MILYHNFITAGLEKWEFKSNFINWINIFLYEQESCVINGGVTTQYFRLKIGARQGGPISAYLIILRLKILLILIKKTMKILK